VLQRHFDEVAAAVETVCAEQRGQPLGIMLTALVETFLRVKMRDGKGSVALYEVSSDVDGVRLVQKISGRLYGAIAAMLRSAPDANGLDADLVTMMLQGAMSGVSRRLLESDDPERMFAPMCAELTAMVQSYVAGRRQQTAPR
jgi:hypothetical protein